MALVNENYLKLSAGYLFPEIARRVNEFAAGNPQAEIIRLGIGDVTEPLPEAIAQAMHKAVDEMSTASRFRGYGPSEGYDFLRQAIVEHDYKTRGCDVAADEVFVSDGSKSDGGNILDILGQGNTIAIADPVYPIYVDTNVMAGHTGVKGEDGRYEGLVYLPATHENGFAPALPDRPVDVIYLCFPNNPTGAVASRESLEQWVEYANKHKALLMFDAAYEAFISDDSIPHSIYEIEGARDCAIEFRSFSKTAGFTGTRCAFVVVPKQLMGQARGGEKVGLHALWKRRQSTRNNGVAYVVQRGAEAAYSPEGREQIRALIAGYMSNAAAIKTAMEDIGLRVFGANNAPYAWIQCPEGIDSWAMFDRLLSEAGVVCTPGVGFGRCGEGYIRLSAFNSRANVDKAMHRITEALA